MTSSEATGGERTPHPSAPPPGISPEGSSPETGGETHRERQARISRYTNSRLVAYVLQHGAKGRLEHPRLSSLVKEGLGLSDGAFSSVINRLLAAKLLDVGYAYEGKKKILAGMEVDPDTITQAIEAGLLVAVENPAIVPPDKRHVTPRGTGVQRAPIRPRNPGTSLPLRWVLREENLQPAATPPRSQNRHETPDHPEAAHTANLTAEEVEVIISDLSPAARLAIVLRHKRVFESIQEMQQTLIKETKLAWKPDLSDLIKFFSKQKWAIFDKLIPTGPLCWAELTSEGLRFLEASLEELRVAAASQEAEANEVAGKSIAQLPDGTTMLSDGDEVKLRKRPAKD